MLVRSEIISLLNEVLGEKPRIRKGGGQVVYHCYKCHHTKKKMEVLLEEGEKFGIFSCWVCRHGGTVYSLLKDNNATVSQMDRYYKLTEGIKTIRKKRASKKKDDKLCLPEDFIPLWQPKSKDIEYKNAIKYLKKRGLLWEDICRYNIGYCVDGDFAYHVIIPSYDADGELNYFIGRRYYDGEAGVINYKKPKHDMNIIGFENLINWNEPIILVESPFNAITIRRNAIPMFGKYPSEKLIEKLIVNKVKEVYVFLDSDAANDILNVGAILTKWGIVSHFVKINGGKDPNEIGYKKSWECVKCADEMDEEFLFKQKMMKL